MRRGGSALLIIDVQNDFCAGGALAVPGAERVVAALNRHIDEALAQDLTVYATRDWHPPVTRHFKEYGGEWPPHCVRNTTGAQFHPDLRLPDSTIVVSTGQSADSQGYSAFEGQTPDGKPLAAHLRERGIDHLFVGGLATDYCVRHSVLDARREGLRVTVLKDAIAGIDLKPGDVDRALAEMEEAGATVREG